MNSLYQISLRNDSQESALVLRIFTKYAEWDRLADKFGMLSLSREVFREILNATDANELVEAAGQLGSRTPKAGILFWFKKANVETFLEGLQNLFRYGRTAECEVKVDGTDHVVIIRHELGLKWSEFLKSYLDAGAKTVLGIQAQFDVTPSLLSMSFKAET